MWETKDFDSDVRHEKSKQILQLYPWVLLINVQITTNLLWETYVELQHVSLAVAQPYNSWLRIEITNQAYIFRMS